MNKPGDMRAAEYVLGTLPRIDRMEFARLVASHVAVQDAVLDWENRLMPLCAIIEDVAPPADLWDRILAALPDQPEVSAPNLYAIETAERARETAELMASRGAWRKATIAASLAACTAVAACATLLIMSPNLLPRPASQSSYIAAVNRGGDQPALIVRVDLATGKIFVRPVALETPPGRDLELWYISYGKAPATMGVIAKEPETKKIPLGASLDKAKIAVSVEPMGGSSSGKPTGPIVYSGDLIKD